MASEVRRSQDLYELLGVEPGATVESIRTAYRLLAREHHPDGKALDREEAAAATAFMTELNAAWEVLSDPVRRRAHDRQRRIDQMLTQAEALEAGSAGDGRVARVGEGGASSAAAAAEPRLLSSAAIEASFLIREKLLSDRSTFRWESAAMEGFDWALRARFLTSTYCVALASQATVDPKYARRFVAAARSARRSAGGMGRTPHDVFLLLVERASGLEQVLSMLRDFSASAEGKRAVVVMIDATRLRGVLCGPSPRQEKLRKVLESFGLGGI